MTKRQYRIWAEIFSGWYGRLSLEYSAGRKQFIFSCAIQFKLDIIYLFADLQPHIFVKGPDGDYIFRTTRMIEVVGGI
jgi:hypothetical protein